MTEETIKEILKFRDDRDWKKFHNPKDLAISISLEAAEVFLQRSNIYDHHPHHHPTNRPGNRLH